MAGMQNTKLCLNNLFRGIVANLYDAFVVTLAGL
jgi:hypothetical protein